MKNYTDKGAVSRKETALNDKPRKYYKSELVRLIIMSVCVAVFICSGTYIADYYLNSYLNGKRNNEIREMFTEQPTENYSERFESLLETNPETKGWITIPGTDIDYPIVQTNDSEFYLTHNFERQYSNYGTIFADAACCFDQRTGTSDNTVVYGHNMKDGSMFGQLGRYRQIDFYKSNPVLTFIPICNVGSTKYKVVSVFICDTNASGVVDPLNMFYYNSYVNLSDKAMYDTFIKQITARSLISTGIDVRQGDKFVTLSTCSFDFEDSRLVVVARQVRQGESEEVDTSEASSNGNAVYPRAFCEKYGRTYTPVQ